MNHSEDEGSLGKRFLEGFDQRLAESKRIVEEVEPLKQSLPVFLKTQEALKGEPLTMTEVIDFTVQFLQEEEVKAFLSQCLARGLTIHDVIREIVCCLWLHYQMKDYCYLQIDPDPTFTCSLQIENALRAKLETVGLIERPD